MWPAYYKNDANKCMTGSQGSVASVELQKSLDTSRDQRTIRMTLTSAWREVRGQ